MHVLTLIIYRYSLVSYYIYLLLTARIANLHVVQVINCLRNTKRIQQSVFGLRILLYPLLNCVPTTFEEDNDEIKRVC